MSEWFSDNPEIVNWVLKQVEKEGDKLPVLVLKIMHLYKLKLLANPKKVEGTDEGFMVKVKNIRNGKDYLLFLQRTLASKFKQAGAKTGDVLAVINKGKNMQTGYDFMVTRWEKSFDTYYNKKEHLKRILDEDG